MADIHLTAHRMYVQDVLVDRKYFNKNWAHPSSRSCRKISHKNQKKKNPSNGNNRMFTVVIHIQFYWCPNIALSIFNLSIVVGLFLVMWSEHAKITVNGASKCTYTQKHVRIKGKIVIFFNMIFYWANPCVCLAAALSFIVVACFILYFIRISSFLSFNTHILVISHHMQFCNEWPYFYYVG